MAVYIIVLIIAYLIGSVNFSILISKKMAGFDVREKGSGNAGTTNVLRTVGKKAAAITLCCDILKGVFAVLIARTLGIFAKDLNPAILVELAAIGVVIGHTFPIFFGFKGGKGVATSLGIILIINWRIGLACFLFWFVLVALTRMVSLGSISAAVLFAVLTIIIRDNYITTEYHWSYIIFGIALACFVVFNHRANLKRILSGTENKLSFKKKEENNTEVSDTKQEVSEEENKGE